MREIARRVRRHPLGWKYVHNARALSWRRSLPAAGSVEASLVDSLDRDGLAVSNIEQLGLLKEFEDLQALVPHLTRPDPVEKEYLSELLGHRPVLDPNGTPARLAARFFPVADGHLGVYAQLRYFNVWHNSVNAEEPSSSQRWHRDRDDLKIVKVFVYLSDVDAGAGPFWYAKGTHSTGRVRGDAPSQVENGVARSDDRDLLQLLPSSEWVECMGTAGTVVLADTSGYHRGGWCVRKPRTVFTAMLTSPGSHSVDWFERPPAPPTARRYRYRWA